MISVSGKSCALERAADHADAAVHHVGGAEDVAAGLGLDERHLLEREQGLVVLHDAAADEAVVAVGVVGVEGDVEQDADLGDRGLDRAGGAADQVLGVPGLGRLGVLVGRRRCRGRARGSRCRGAAASSAARTARSMERRATPGSEATGSARSRPSRTKIGQIRSDGAEPRLGDHLADPGRPAQPARAGEREGGDRGHRASSRSARPGCGTGARRPQAVHDPLARRLTPARRCGE